MRSLSRYLGNRQTIIWALTLTALLCLPAALRKAAPDAAFTLFVPVVLLGLLGGFLIHGPRFRGAGPAAIFVGGGAVVLFVRVGQIGRAIAASLYEATRIAWLLMLPSIRPGHPIYDPSAWLSAQNELLNEVLGFAQRVWLWLADILQGAPTDDPAARALVLSLVLWLLVGWASWRIRARDDPIGGLLPASLTLGLSLDLMYQNRWPLWVHIGAFLLLLPAVNLSRLTAAWTAEHTDFSESITEDSLLSAILIIILVAGIAYTASVVSIQDVLDALREHQKPVTAAVTSPGNGVAPSSRRITSGPNATLEGVHTIAGGPTLTDDVVMYVSTGDLPPIPHAMQIQPPHYYWRGATYQNYTGVGWNNHTALDLELPADTQLLQLSPAGYRKIHATVTVPAGLRAGMYWTGVLVETDQSLVVLRRLDLDLEGNPDVIGAVVRNGEAGSSQSYTFDSLLAETDEAALRAAPATYPEWIRGQYLALPDSLPERVRALGRDVTARGRTPYDRALAIERYLRKLPYSLEVPGPPSGRDAADYFLFDLKRGYCDYYATAMAVLARAAGLPARLVVGYASGRYDPYAAQYVITKADAHAWTEIYFPGIGWIEFEPTPGQPVPARERNRAPAQQVEHPAQSNPTWESMPAAYAAASRLGGSFLTVMLLMGFSWLVIDQARLRLMAAEEATRRVYLRTRRLTHGMSAAPPLGQTAREHAVVVARTLADVSSDNGILEALARPVSAALIELTDLYMRSLFAPSPLTYAEGRKALGLWSVLSWRLAVLRIVFAVTRRPAPSKPRGLEGT